MKVRNALLLTALAVLLTATVLTIESENEGSEDTDQLVRQDVDDGSYLLLGGAFNPEKDMTNIEVSNNVISAHFNLSGYSEYNWTIIDEDKPRSTSTTSFCEYTGDEITTTTPDLTLSTPGYGDYQIILSVDDEEFSGEIVLISTLTKNYEFEFDNENCQITFEISYEEYYETRKIDSNRSPTDDRYSDFVTEDDSVSQIADEILAISDGNADDAAAIALSFGQLFIAYPPCTLDGNGSFIMSPDMYLVGKENYAFYPIETLFLETGDCEDTSILYASILKAMNIETGLLLMPGHMMALAELTGGDPENSNSSLSLYKTSVDDRTYYVCETSSSQTIPVGYAYESVTFGGNDIQYYLNSNYIEFI